MLRTRLSVCLSVTVVSRALSGSRYRNMLCTIWQRVVIIFLRQNSPAPISGFTPMSVLKRGTSLLTPRIWPFATSLRRCKIGSRLSYYYPLIGSTIRTSHCYGKWWPWTTLNGVMAVILRYFTEFGSFGANYVKVVEDRPILHDLWWHSQRLLRKICQREALPVKSETLINTARKLGNGAR